jgi:hypothetical protein
MKLLMISGFAVVDPARCRNHHAAVALAFDRPSCRGRKYDVAANRSRCKQASDRGV